MKCKFDTKIRKFTGLIPWFVSRIQIEIQNADAIEFTDTVYLYSAYWYNFVQFFLTYTCQSF